jgi:HNH endonuclease
MMIVKWDHQRCIVCLAEKSLSEEHVIPKSLGGILTSSFLCNSCNSAFGSGFEANARLSPEIRQAVTSLEQIPIDFKEKLERGSSYVSQFGNHTATQKVRADGNLTTTRLGDGSLIVPEHEAAKHIESIMRKDGGTDAMVEQALAKWENSLPYCEIDLGSGVKVIKWNEHPANPAYTELQLSPLVALKIAYEFSALIVGKAIYRSELQQIRDVLMSQDEDVAAGMVTYNWAHKPDTFHGIAFAGNKPTAQFQVRLFGLLAYTICFPKIAISYSPIAYTHRLDTKEDWVRLTGNTD